MSLHQVYARTGEVLVREVAGETVLVPVRGQLASLRRLFTLNEVGRFIWDQVDGKTAVEEIHRRLVERFEVADDEALRDLETCLDEMLDAELIVPAGLS